MIESTRANATQIRSLVAFADRSLETSLQKWKECVACAKVELAKRTQTPEVASYADLIALMDKSVEAQLRVSHKGILAKLEDDLIEGCAVATAELEAGNDDLEA